MELSVYPRIGHVGEGEQQDDDGEWNGVGEKEGALGTAHGCAEAVGVLGMRGIV
ncbi:hypothetical protein HPT28_00620 [Streptomyces sp. JJ38]|nr:hypothetical protein [Streptomyces sp. JJ38]